MKLHFLITLACTTHFTLVNLAQAQEISLFNGTDLDGWNVKGGPASFQAKDGCIVGKAVAGKSHTFLCTQAQYGDFVLTFEFMTAPNLNSGVQFRSQVFDKDVRVPMAKQGIVSAGRVHGYQYEIDTSGRFFMAGIYDEGRRGSWLGGDTTAPVLQAAYKPGQWNQGRIECVGTSLKTYLNGVPAASATDSLTPVGIIALQIHGKNPPGSEVRWRNLKLLPLRPGQMPPSVGTPLASASTSPSPLSTIQTDANQPRIEVIKDQGPNATEWALTPLDEAIPADIRQNLTFLREDLLDEGKKAAKSSPEAYKLASDYCDKLLAALDQRELARVNAGYAAAQADANKRISTQALDARRNHQMSWPQFSREESQRAALRENEADKADVKKQRLKVEWTSRAVQMRTYLDDLYRQLRESMR
jgi:hypothetical protein